jgi:hypothetical protein
MAFVFQDKPIEIDWSIDWGRFLSVTIVEALGGNWGTLESKK